MLRKLSIGLVVSVSLSTAAFAQGQFGIAAATRPTMSVQATKTAARLAKGQKLCRSKKPDGSVKTWTCGVDQPCCVNHFFSLYTCGSQLLKCL
jgi:hypothetical protein